MANSDLITLSWIILLVAFLLLFIASKKTSKGGKRQ